MRVSTSAQMRELDRRASADYGIPSHLLMEHAGHAVYALLRERVGAPGRRYAIFCGGGNNGGDGLVVARKLCSAGARVDVFVLGDPARYGSDAKLNYDIACRCGVAPKSGSAALDRDAWHAALASADAVVDALFGTGLTREVAGDYRDAVDAINGCGKPVYAVDIPSGVDGDSGQVHGVAVRARATVSFGLPKQGNLLYPGAGYGGELFVSAISFPPELQQSDELRVFSSPPSALPPRAADGHKGSFGDVLFVAGAGSYFGAPAFSALAHLRAGGGYARLAAPRSVVSVVAALAPELIFLPQDETPEGALMLQSAEALLAAASDVDMVVLGPGLSLALSTQQLVRKLTRELKAPLLLDGDALTAIAAEPEALVERSGETVLTPHLGELSRLTGKSIAVLRSDPIGALRELATSLGVTCVLKGAHSLIGMADGRVYINPTGNSGMASAGSGDVLTGTIAALFGQGLSLPEATRSGVFVHGLAGDLAAAARGEDGIIARDLLEYLPPAVARFRADYDELTTDCYGAVHRL